MFEISSNEFERIYYIQAKTSEDCEEWIQAIEKGNLGGGVSGPFDVQHNVHVDFKSETGFVVIFSLIYLQNLRRKFI